MARDLISRKTRSEFREYFVGITLRAIELDFDAADIVLPEGFQIPEIGQRRGLVEGYYRNIDFTSWRDVRKVLNVYAAVLGRLEGDATTFDTAKRAFDSLKKWLERDGFSYANGRVTSLRDNLHVTDVQEAARSLDAPELHRQIERLKDSATEDPALAIGTAKELVETVCKTILEAKGVSAPENLDITGLVKQARKVLKLLPEDVAAATKGAEAITRVLSSLGAIAQGLGELRNLYGTGHGRSGKTQGLSSRHAQLAVGAAATLVTFLLQTHEDREKAEYSATQQAGRRA